MNHEPIKPAMGILRPAQAGRHFRLTRKLPSAELQALIKHYWIVEWQLDGLPPYDQEVVPNPCVNLVVERGNTFFYGPSAQKYAHHLEGSGGVFGVKFQPGGFYPFLRSSVSDLQTRPLPPSTILALEGPDLERLLLDSSLSDDKRAEVADKLFMAVLPPGDPQVKLVSGMVAYIAEHQELSRVEQLCSIFGYGIRTLQRLFGQYVGLSPKTVIRLYRLQNAAEAMEGGQQLSLLELSLELGYHDQAHFIKDFKAVIGLTPEQYIRSKP